MAPEDPKDMPCCCQRCGCEKHKCPSRMVKCKYPSQIKTLYQQDFIQHPSVKNEFYNVNKMRRDKAEHKMEPTSCYQLDFPAYNLGKKEVIKRNRPSTAKVPFLASTSYQNEFINWGASAQPPSSKDKKTYGVQFQGKSTYTDSFIPMDLKARAQPMKSVYLNILLLIGIYHKLRII